MSDVHFAAPGWIHAIWGVLALVAILFALERRGDAAMERILGPLMRARLVSAPSAGRRRLGLLLLLLCGVCLVLGLMRPQWGFRHFASQRAGAEIMVALDVSRSMLAEDVAPTRLARAKAEIGDLLSYLDGDQVGLIAFAGRASVLSPLTPDFGFLRIVLEAAGPESVTRGGTKLAEPIRKAVAGFGAAGDASRAILLITDGEDHDSFALDAAREAGEAGIKIIAIGFGDEAGSEIPLTDPRSGARTLVLDGDGRPVRSRLDGDVLREIALATGGAYVPAGTGVLDLESIYARHIERLTRGRLDARGRTVRDEYYQWPLLFGVLFLVSSVLVAAGPLGTRALAVGLVLVPLAGPSARAQDAESARDAAAPVVRDDESRDAGEDPREIYNRGVDELDGSEWQQAGRVLERARAEAGGDGTLRFRASYNLGVAAARDAEGLEADQPQQALASLKRSAAWFQEAVGLRPDHEHARHNLEVTLRRALLLEDRLAREGQSDLAEELEALAGRQRGVVAGSAALLERTGVEERSDPHAVDRYRREFAGQATSQRTLLSDADALAERIATEWDALQSRAQDEQPPEERMRGAALGAVLEHLHGARERMGQARSQLRRRQAERAYRRASAALRGLERARDPLRDPVSLLDALIAEASELAAATALLAAAGRDIPGLDRPVAPPAWLRKETLEDSQSSVQERTGELHARLRAGVAAPGDAADPAAADQLERQREAEPFVGRAREQLERASVEVAAGSFDMASEAQRLALEALAEARERFLDLRGLIEAAYAAERRIQFVLGSEEAQGAAVRREYLPSLRDAQQKNLARGRRVEQRLERQLAAESAAEPSDAAAEREKQAREALAGATWAMGDVEQALERGAAGWSKAAEGADTAVRRLDDLRRLFFSIGERVRELAERQLELADATRDAAALEDAAPPEQGHEVLAPRQETLAGRTGEVALELAAQSDAAAQPPSESDAAGAAPGAADADQAAETARRLRLAGEHALTAEDAMKAAHAELVGEPARAGEAHGHQEEALRELGEALALLTPPQQQDDGEDRSESGEGEQDSQQAQEQEQQSAQAPAADPAQLLQAVRDREAQRRRDRARSPRARYEPVEKDW